MPEIDEDEIMRRYPTLGLDIIILDELKEGSIVTVPQGENEQLKETVHYEIKQMRECIKDIYEAYSRKATKQELVTILEKHKESIDTYIHDFLGRVENIDKNEKIFKIAKKEIKKGEVTIKLKEVPQNEKKEIVKSIVKKLIGKVTRDQLEAMFEQSILKLNDMEKLKKVDKALDKNEPKIEGKRGCYQLLVDDIDVMMIG